MWEDYVRKEELVNISIYDGSEAMMAELVEDDPSVFEIRLNDKGAKTLIIKDATTYIKVEPNTCIVEDSCGRYYTYEPDFLDFVFRPISNRDESFQADIDGMAETLYERFLGVDDSVPSDWGGITDIDKEPFIAQAEKLLDDFYVVRR